MGQVMTSSNIRSRIDLAKYFAELGLTIGAEIGVDGGVYSAKLCEANPKLKLYCIDPWDLNEGTSRERRIRKYAEAKERLKPYNAKLIRKFSMDAVKDFKDGSLDFVYIDGNHNFDYVMQDIIEWSKKVKKGGIIAGHDYSDGAHVGVKDAVDLYVKHHFLKLELLNVPNATCIPRDSDDQAGLSWWFFKKWNSPK